MDAHQIEALRQGLTEAGGGFRLPRIVIGRDPGAAPQAAGAVTLLDINPVRRAALITAVAIAAGRASPETMPVVESEPVADIPPPTVEEALAQGRLILVAEDHIANQDVLRRQLNRLGYACEIAEDGVAALALWRSKTYALLLTDCHMPNLDGFGLTAEIRRTEAAGTRAPIVAITANVLQGEAERCLAAGMDAFLPKPVELATLGATLAQWMGGASAPRGMGAATLRAATPAGQPAPDGDLPVLDLDRIRDAFGEIDDGVREYFGVFEDSVRPLLSQFEHELETARHLEARETIHKAKGAVANAGGKQLAAVMHEIEKALVEQDYGRASVHAQNLRPAWDRLTDAIAHT
jgi:CheY-like chemotaxis protein